MIATEIKNVETNVPKTEKPCWFVLTDDELYDLHLEQIERM